MVCCVQTGLPGFYDPCVGEEKSLKVLYQFRGVMHQVLSGDTEALRIPKQCKLFSLCDIAIYVYFLFVHYYGLMYVSSPSFFPPAHRIDNDT